MALLTPDILAQLAPPMVLSTFPLISYGDILDVLFNHSNQEIYL